VKDIAQRYHVTPDNIVGHTEIAPQRKQDPGPMFPWYRFAQEGLIVWPDANRVAAVRPTYEAQLPDAVWFQQKLAQHGYGITPTGIFDEQTRNVLSAFQSKFRPANIDGNADAETAAMLDVLTTPAVPAAAPTPAPAPAPALATTAPVVANTH
jgi:N-acetylmuramoyl-L-alanine amidase